MGLCGVQRSRPRGCVEFRGWRFSRWVKPKLYSSLNLYYGDSNYVSYFDYGDSDFKANWKIMTRWRNSGEKRMKQILDSVAPIPFLCVVNLPKLPTTEARRKRLAFLQQDNITIRRQSIESSKATIGYAKPLFGTGNTSFPYPIQF